MVDEVDFYLVDLKSRFDKIKPNTYYLSYSGGKESYEILCIKIEGGDE